MNWLHSFCWRYFHFDGSNLLKAAYRAWKRRRSGPKFKRSIYKYTVDKYGFVNISIRPGTHVCVPAEPGEFKVIDLEGE